VQINLRQLCFVKNMHVVVRATHFADPPCDVIMEELYVHKKLGPCCCECFLMNNLRGRSDSTFSSRRKIVDGEVSRKF
jgi:hypothetical protein